MTSFIIKSFQKGISDYDEKGVEGSSKHVSGLDIRKKSDTLTCGNALADINTISVTGVIRWWVPANDGNLYGFASDGKIYKITPSFVLSLVYTDPDGAIKGASMGYKSDGTNWLCWATDTKLKLKPLPGNSGWSDVTTKATNLTSANWHTMRQIDDSVYVCNGSFVGLLDYTHVWNQEAFNLIPFHTAKTLAEQDNYIVIGTEPTDGSERGYLYLWDGASDRFTRKRKLATRSVDAIIFTEVMVFSSNASIYSTDIINNTSTVPVFMFPEIGATVNPDGVNEYKGMAAFGVYGNGNGYTGIYTYGRKRLADSFARTLEYPLDCNEIGAVTVYNQTLIFSYKTGSTHGIKRESTTAKAVGYYYGLDLKAPDKMQKGLDEPIIWEKIVLLNKNIPTGAKIECFYRANKNGSYIQARLNNDSTDFTTGTEAIFMIDVQAVIFDFYLKYTPVGNESPETLMIQVDFA